MPGIPLFTKGNTATLSVTGTSSTAPFPVGSGTELRFANEGPNTVFVVFASATGSTATANVTGALPLLPGTVELFTIDTTNTFLSAVTTATGNTGILYITRGQGM